MLLGSSLTAYPILAALKKNGLEVTVVGNDPEDFCHKFADTSYYEDYSKIKSVEKYLESKRHDFLVPSCNDISYKSGVALAEIFNFPGFDSPKVADQIYDKLAFRSALSKVTKHTARHYEIETKAELPSGLEYPVLVKPKEGSTGFGISYAKNESDLAKLLSSLEGNKKFLVEEFFSGSLHSVSIFFEDGISKKKYFVDEFCTDYPYAVNESCAPTFLSDNLKNLVVLELEKIHKQLNLVDGLLHTQFLVRNDNFMIVESMRRSPGDLYGRLIELSYHERYYDSYVASFIGQKLTKETTICSQVKPHARQTLTNLTESIIQGVEFGATGKVIQSYSLSSAGEMLKRFPVSKQGIIFLQYDDLSSMRAEVGTLKDKNRVF